jgi:adiponectin receptor
MRTLRGGVFSLLAISAMLPAFHRVRLTGWTRACNEMGVHWYLAEALSLLLGVGLFVGRLPERLSPGSFDI